MIHYHHRIKCKIGGMKMQLTKQRAKHTQKQQQQQPFIYFFRPETRKRPNV